MGETPEPARLLALYGTDEAVGPRRRLSAGRLSAEMEGGNLRNIRWDGIEVLLAVAFVIRDTRWGTPAIVTRAFEIGEEPGAFAVTNRGECHGDEGAFVFEASIKGTAEGTLRFEALGRSPAGFSTNRTGFVVLHGIEGTVGRPLRVTHTSGETSETTFPMMVRSDQPASDIAELSYEPAAGLRIEIAFEGDAFEMEDQRNWTDASFKTYVRPLSRGYPYRIEAGEVVRQAVEVRIKGSAARQAAGAAVPVTVRWGDTTGTLMPRVGLYGDAAMLAHAEAHAAALAALRPSYLQARIDLAAENAMQRLDQARALTKAIGCRLQLDLVIGGIRPLEELAAAAAWLASRDEAPDAVFVVPARDLRSRPPNHVPTGQASPAEILAAARALLPGIFLYGGMPVGFPELNRNRPPSGIDGVAHATQAIVHAADDASVMETLEAFPYVIASTRCFAGAVPYRLGPTTIGMVPSASASAPVGNADKRRLPLASDDPRQRGLFAASFLVGIVAAALDVEALTLAAPTGSSGLLDEFGKGFPAAVAFAGMADLAGRPRLVASHKAPGRLAAVAAMSQTGPTLWLANLTPGRLDVSLDGPTFHQVRIIDADHLAHGSADLIKAEPPTGSSVALDAYAVCCFR